MTVHRLPTLPDACPPWCTYHYGGWTDGLLDVAFHRAYLYEVPWPPGDVGTISVETDRDGAVNIELSIESYTVTSDQARELAAKLIEAAGVLDGIQQSEGERS